MISTFVVRAEQDALIISFPAPARALSWAVVNGGFCHAHHVINHRVRGNDPWFCAQPGRWLERAALELGLEGKVVAMATAVEMKNLVRVSMSSGGAEVICFATVGCGNALSVGDPASVAMAEPAPAPLHTINMILAVQPGLTDEAMVEAMQIATEGRVRALYEAGISSSVSSLVATGTGTDCIAVVSLGGNRSPYCGKHTQLGELIGRTAYTAVKNGLAQGATTNGAAPGENSHDA
ncbi:MAG: adenosylcobinamide amidohydrolase [Candidatus Binatia bacterium]